MPPRKTTKKELLTVAPVDGMIMSNFLRHCKDRHPLMRFLSKGEHEADHRLHQKTLEHVHTNQIEQEHESAEDGL